jgi:phosphoribosylformylglycinamidine synthase subunit PurQ / glutaminase
MAQPRVLVLRAPGTNCDAETAHAFELAGGAPQILHINRMLDSPRLALQYQVLCIPGGFSYGDDVAAGRILGNQIRHHFADAMREFREAGKLILGICNGFQVLIKSGLLDVDDATGPSASLTWNDSGKFMDRWVGLRNLGQRCVFLQEVSDLVLRITCAEGKFVTRDADSLARLEQNGQLVLRYADTGGMQAPFNPNGSVADVAGICDLSGRVFGLMPHPESYIDFTQHPQWTRLEERGEGQGLAIFRNAVRYFS